MPPYIPIINQEEYPVAAYLKDTGELVGVFDNAYKAARALFIKNPSSIFSNILRSKKPKRTGRPSGVKSRKTGIVYLFEYSKP